MLKLVSVAPGIVGTQKQKMGVCVFGRKGRAFMHNADTSTRSHTCHWAGPRLYELILWLGLGVINYWWAVTVDQNEKDLNLLSPTAGKHVTWNMSICTYVCGASSSVSGTGWLWTAHTHRHTRAHTQSHFYTQRPSPSSIITKGNSHVQQPSSAAAS